jgi:hypothetical protein
MEKSGSEVGGCRVGWVDVGSRKKVVPEMCSITFKQEQK